MTDLLSEQLSEQSIGLVSKVLEAAEKHNLLPEVVTLSLLHMKSDPSISIERAMYLGFTEWVK